MHGISHRFTWYIMKLIAVSCCMAYSIYGKDLLAVLDLSSDGSVSVVDAKIISDKISLTLQRDTAFKQFDRSYIPELFRQLSLDPSAAACSDAPCLTVIGKLIGANAIIGGFIRNDGRKTLVDINLVDVGSGKATKSVHLSSKARRGELIVREIPSLIEAILKPGDVPEEFEPKRKKNFFTHPATYITALMFGGAAAGGYYYYHHYYQADDKSADPLTQEIPLDDVPFRTRN